MGESKRIKYAFHIVNDVEKVYQELLPEKWFRR